MTLKKFLADRWTFQQVGSTYPKDAAEDEQRHFRLLLRIIELQDDALRSFGDDLSVYGHDDPRCIRASRVRRQVEAMLKEEE